jgi:hypothetical protein
MSYLTAFDAGQDWSGIEFELFILFCLFAGGWLLVSTIFGVLFCWLLDRAARVVSWILTPRRAGHERGELQTDSIANCPAREESS